MSQIVTNLLDAWICSTEIPKAGLPTSPDWVEDEVPTFEPAALSSYSLSSLLLQLLQAFQSLYDSP